MEKAEPRLIDARGLRCPWPALRLARAMREGNAARIVTDDAIAPNELRALSQERGWSIVPVKTSIGAGFLVSS